MLGSYNWNEPGTDSNDAFCFLCVRLEISGLPNFMHSHILTKCHTLSPASGTDCVGHQEIVQFLPSLIGDMVSITFLIALIPSGIIFSDAVVDNIHLVSSLRHISSSPVI